MSNTQRAAIKPQPRKNVTNGKAMNQVIDPDILEIDLNHLTIAEIETIEEITGTPIDALQDPKLPKGKTLRAIAYVVGKRDDPEYTLEQAGQKRVMFEMTPVTPTSGGNS